VRKCRGVEDGVEDGSLLSKHTITAYSKIDTNDLFKINDWHFFVCYTISFSHNAFVYITQIPLARVARWLTLARSGIRG
jgi:hypothetical protein